MFGVFDSKDTLQKKLIRAARDGDMEGVKKYLAKGADINRYMWVSPRHDTPLSAAFSSDSYEIAGYLLDQGATCDLAGVLRDAARAGKLPLLKFCLERGQDPLAADSDGDNALHYAAFGGSHAILEYLLKKVGHANTPDKKGRLPLHRVIETSHNYDPDIALLLIDHTSDINAVTSEGSTFLHSKLLSKEYVKKLLERGIKTDVADLAGDTALHYAASNSDLVSLLLDHGVSPGVANKAGRTPLHEAAAVLNHESFRALVDKGADVNARDNQGDTPLHAVLGANRAQKNTEESVRLLLQLGADVNSVNNSGISPLHLAVKSRYAAVENLALLLEKKANVNAQDVKGWTALHYASEHNWHDGMRLLMEYDADPSVTTDDGKTAGDVFGGWRDSAVVEEMKKQTRKLSKARAASDKVATTASEITIAHALADKRVLVETFNFRTRERITVFENHAIKAVSPPLRESFDDIRDKEPIREALAEFVKKGGKADPSVVYADPRGQKKPFPPKSEGAF